jgi:acyl-CoA reductase-like NAD-dependent aldehyde dehydrogenase
MPTIDVPEWIPRVAMAGDEVLPSLGEQPVVAPYDRAEIARVAVSGEDAVDAAVVVARASLGHAPPASERARILDRAAALVDERAGDLARVLAAESGKPLKQARGEVARCVDTLRFSGAVARTLAGEVIPMDAADSGAGLVGMTVREPIGVLAAITPFNFPLNLVAHKLGPAVAVGAPVVLKPAGKAPLSGLALAAILREAGLPHGQLGWVLGDGVAGEPLTSHPDVSMVSFTGSSTVGWAIRAARPDIRVALELGNATPLIVHDDADLAAAARAIAGSAFTHAGQSCISVQRVLVHRRVHDALMQQLLPLVDALVVGDPLDDSTDVGPVIDAASADRIIEWIDEATQVGARVVRGGERLPDGPCMIAPTVLDGVAPFARVMREEVFGPVIAVCVYDRVDDAIAIANDSPLGLQAGIFTARTDMAMAWARRLDFGGVVINETPTFRADHMPYGGVRGSGDAREGPAAAALEMTYPKLVITRIPAHG